MKLENDKIVLETRSEISLLQDMIECYIKHEPMEDPDKEGLKQLNKELDSLWCAW